MATYTVDNIDTSSLQINDIINCDYSGSMKQIELPPGQYKLECWGAKSIYSSASPSSSYTNGYGGYASGNITLDVATTLYLYVGGAPGSLINGTSSYYNGGYNGGGASYSGSSYNDNAPGAGATDIALIGGECTLDSYQRYVRTTQSYKSRLIVAGGGGGGRSGNTLSNGGYGGMPCTTTGVNGSISSIGSCATGSAGGFGYGATSTATSDDSPGGGGGWYGGGNVSDSYGGGGSSFVWCDNTSSYVPSDYIPTNDLKMTNVSCIAGGSTMIEPSGNSTTGHSGDGYIRITVLNIVIDPNAPKTYNIDAINSSIKLKTGDEIKCPYSGIVKTLTLPKGIYKLECWGAQGGSYSSYYGGYGGYSVGNLTLTEETNLYLYVGGQPATHTSTSTSPAGFNGGGTSHAFQYDYYTYGQGGGGASDIRINQDSLYARVIVAGGGGGSASVNAATTKYGGGISGGSPQSGYSASQTAAGTNGSFGQGGNATASGTNYNYGSGGGGGGWYGGGACSSYSDGTDYRGYNGGGSGYVYTSSTASNYPSGCLLNSSYYLTDAQTIAGNASFPSTSKGTETGHSGNGYIKITVVKIKGLTGKVKINNEWKDINTLWGKINNEWIELSSLWGKINSEWIES